MENTTLSAERLACAWCQLNKEQWPEDVLGEMPDGADPATIRHNAMTAIEETIGTSALSHYWHTHELGRTSEEWLRWYTAGRFRYNARKQEHTRRKRLITALAIAALAAIAIRIALYW